MEQQTASDICEPSLTRELNQLPTANHIDASFSSSPDNSPKSRLIASLKQDIIPPELLRGLQVYELPHPALQKCEERILDVIQKFLPGLDPKQHAVRILLSADPKCPAARLCFTPTTTIVVSVPHILTCRDEGELAITVLHEVFHALCAKGYKPHEVFDIYGLEHFRLRAEREKQAPDVGQKAVDKLEESGAYTLPLLLLADQGYDPRIYKDFYEKLFEQQVKARTRRDWGVVEEILDVHPLPESVDALCEAISAAWISTRGALPSLQGESLDKLHEELRNMQRGNSFPNPAQQWITRAGYSTETPSQRCEALLAYLQQSPAPEYREKELLQIFEDTPPTQKDASEYYACNALHSLADFAIKEGLPSLYQCLQHRANFPGAEERIVGQDFRIFASLRANLIEAVSTKELRGEAKRNSIIQAAEALSGHWTDLNRRANSYSIQKALECVSHLLRSFEVPTAAFEGFVPWQPLYFIYSNSSGATKQALRSAALCCGLEGDWRFAANRRSYFGRVKALEETGIREDGKVVKVRGDPRIGESHYEDYLAQYNRLASSAASGTELLSQHGPELEVLKDALSFERQLHLNQSRHEMASLPVLFPDLLPQSPADFLSLNAYSKGEILPDKATRVVLAAISNPEISASTKSAILKALPSKLELANPTKDLEVLLLKAVESVLQLGSAEAAYPLHELANPYSNFSVPLESSSTLACQIQAAILNKLHPELELPERGARSLGEFREKNSARLALLKQAGLSREHAMILSKGSWEETSVRNLAATIKKDAPPTARDLLYFVETATVVGDDRYLLIPVFRKLDWSTYSLSEKVDLWCALTKRYCIYGATSQNALKEIISGLASAPLKTREEFSFKLLASGQVRLPSQQERLVTMWCHSTTKQYGTDPEGTSAGQTKIDSYRAKLEPLISKAIHQLPHNIRLEVLGRLADSLLLQGTLCEFVRTHLDVASPESTNTLEEGWRVAESIQQLARSDLKSREDVFRYLLAPEPDGIERDALASTIVAFIDIKKSHDNFVSSIYTASDKNFLREIEFIYERFWSLPINAQALWLRQLLRVSETELAKMSRAEVRTLHTGTIDIVVQRLFPGRSETALAAQAMVAAHLKSLDPIEMPFVAAGLLCAAHAQRLELRRRHKKEIETRELPLESIGKASALFCDARGTGLQKFSQTLGCLPGVDERIRAPHRKAQHNAQGLPRWELLRHARLRESSIMADFSAGQDGAKPHIAYFGRTLGTGSVASTIEIHLSDKSKWALSLRKPFALECGKYGLESLRKTAALLEESYPQISRVIRQSADDAVERLHWEVDYTVAPQQFKALQAFFKGTSISVRGEVFNGNVPECAAAGEDFMLVELLPSARPWSALQSTGEITPNAAIARTVHVFSNLLHLRIEPDRSAGNCLIEGNNFYDIDPKAIYLNKTAGGPPRLPDWPHEDGVALGRFVAEFAVELLTNKQKSLDNAVGTYLAGIEKLREHYTAKGQPLPLLIRECNKAILTQLGFINNAKVTQTDILLIGASILANGAHASVAHGIVTTLRSTGLLESGLSGSWITEETIESFLVQGTLAKSPPALIKAFLPAWPIEEALVSIERAGT